MLGNLLRWLDAWRRAGLALPLIAPSAGVVAQLPLLLVGLLLWLPLATVFPRPPDASLESPSVGVLQAEETTLAAAGELRIGGDEPPMAVPVGDDSSVVMPVGDGDSVVVGSAVESAWVGVADGGDTAADGAAHFDVAAGGAEAGDGAGDAPVVAVAPMTPGPLAEGAAPEAVLVAPPPEEAVAETVPLPLVARVQMYYVARGDTLASIAGRFGIPVDTIRWANSLPNPDLLYVGTPLTILPVPGVLHTVAGGEAASTVAARYRVATAALLAANGLAEGDALLAGQRLLVPNGRPLVVTPARGTAWPAAGTGGRNKPQFIAAAVGPAQESQRATGVPASVTIAQAILESDWGDSRLAWDANNYFGIKATGNLASQRVYWIRAWEVVDGEDVMRDEPFRAYTSPEASFADHGRFFLENPRYKTALRLTKDPAAFARAIAAAGYATDPAYAAKLIRLMDQYALNQYDLPS
jgi:LysM repeat protein